MIEVEETSLYNMLDQAIHKAEKRKKPLVMSMTKKIQSIDPLAFFEAAGKQSMNRTFWSSTAEDICIAGAGSAFDITAGTNRVEQAETVWDQLLREAVIHNPYEVPGTGILALGGMSFDPVARQSALWSHFPDIALTIPSFMLTSRNEACYLTLNVQVKADDNPASLEQILQQTEDALRDVPVHLPDGPDVQMKQEIDPEKWKKTVQLTTEALQQHHAEKIVLARAMQVDLTGDAVIASLLKKLLETQPTSYVFAFERGGDCFVGASPERLVKQEQDQVLSTCLAGTAPRGDTKEADASIAFELYHDTKNRREHDAVVSMIRQSLRQFCTDLNIPDKPVIYPLKNLQHLYTPVTAALKDGYSLFNIVEQLHPTPALGGVPREKALAYIRDCEDLDRGWYGAPVGWLDSNRNGEFAVGIRSGLIRRDRAMLFAGSGIMKDSDPETEYEETNMKFEPMLAVLGG